MTTIQLLPNETFKEITLHTSLTLRYAISNYGRLVSFTDDILHGRILKAGVTEGYRIFRYTIRVDGVKKYKHVFLYKLVAQQFLVETMEEQQYVIHIDRNRGNDSYKNLCWVTKAEMFAHHKSSPFVIEAKRKLVEHNIKRDGKKLSETQVMLLKKILSDPNRKTRIRLIAKQFGVSEMQLYRIKSGENWGHVKE